MDIEKAFEQERAVWWTLEERGGPRSANASPRGSLTGARALRRGDFASQRSISGTIGTHIVTHREPCLGKCSFRSSGHASLEWSH